MAVASTFHGASRAADTGKLFQQVVDAAGLFVLAYLNGKLLPAQLLSSTHLTSPEHLVASSRELAARRARSLRSRLIEGGVALG